MDYNCTDLNDPVFQGYASPVEQAKLYDACTTAGLPMTGSSLTLFVLVALFLIFAGYLLLRSKRY